jgi:hypothetical protein
MTATPTNILMALLLSGLLGMLGQGIRALVGMKKMVQEAAAKDPTSADAFMASRLLVSLMIGFLAGIAAGLALGLKRILAIGDGDIDLLLGIAAAGYAGTDFIEAFLSGAGSRITAPAGTPAITPKQQTQPSAAAVVSPISKMTIGDIDPRSVTILALLARDHALDETSAALGQDFTGDEHHDSLITLKLAEIGAERVAIAARRGAILSGGTCTPPNASQLNDLHAAMAALHKSVVANADTNMLIRLASALLQTFGSRESA